MNILILTAQLPYPPRQGTTLRNYNLIHHLSQRHTLDLLTFTAPNEQLTSDNVLYQLCRRIESVPQPVRSLKLRLLDTLRSSLPDMALRLESPQMHGWVDEYIRDSQQDTHNLSSYDIIQVEGIEMAQYGLQILEQIASDPHRPRLVFDDHNCEYLLQKRNALTDLRLPKRWPAALYSLIQWQKLRLYEARICRSSDVTLVVSGPDKMALEEIAPDRRIEIVPNGIKTEDYILTEPSISRAIQPASLLVFTGKMDYRPNIDAVLWFGRNVFPKIQEEVQSIRFQIVGMNPHPRLNELRQNAAIEITGTVDDPRPYIQNAAVYVIPMRVGGGTRFKALEAMACGKAIVSTSLGVEGIPVTHGEELLLADTPNAFASEVLRLLQNDKPQCSEFKQYLAANARSFVRNHYEWSQIIPTLEVIYEQSLA